MPFFAFLMYYGLIIVNASNRYIYFVLFSQWFRMHARVIFSSSLIALLVSLSFFSIGTSGILFTSAYSSGSSPDSQTGFTSTPNVTAVVEQLQAISSRVHARTAPTTSTLSPALSNAYSFMSKVSSFQSSLALHGLGSFSWGIGYNFNTGLLKDARIGFNIIWNDSTTLSEESWTGYLTNDTIIGPVLTSIPLEQSASMTSPNWGGYEFYDVTNCGIFGCTYLQLTTATTNLDVPTIQAPPSGTVNNYYFHTIHRVATIWAGLAAQAGGNGGLAQTGVIRDVNNNDPYNLFYELFGCGSNCPLQNVVHYSSNQCSSGSTQTSPGDILSPTVSQSGSTFYFSTYDYNTGDSCFASYNYSEATYFATFIVEAFTEGSTIQQIAQFSPTVNFENGQVYVPSQSSYVTLTSLYNSGYSNRYDMSQDWFTSNTFESYSTAQGTYYTTIVGYPQATWQSSNYDWLYIYWIRHFIFPVPSSKRR